MKCASMIFANGNLSSNFQILEYDIRTGKGVHMQCVGVQTHCTTFSDYTLNILLSLV